MIYGYAVLVKTTRGVGEIWWNEYYEETTCNIPKVRLFKLKAERDNAMKIEKSKHKKDILSNDEVEIIPFTTSSNQGKLNIIGNE